MSGTFALTMITAAGERSADSATGSVALHPQDSGLADLDGLRQSLVGTANIELQSIGATRMGDLAATDPLAPGVAVYEQRVDGVAAVFVRLGSASNARGPAVFDAGHTTLYVRSITGDGFAGGWASSAGSAYPMREARGYFCAVRVQP